jgi:hypothetical protein
MKGRRKKINLFWEWVPVREGWAQGKGNEDEYGGYISYPYMKIENKT